MIVSKDTNPKLSLFYLGGLILSELDSSSNIDLLELYKALQEKTDISFKLFILTLDFLFLLEIQTLNRIVGLDKK